MDRAHPFVSLDALDVRLRRAEHSLTRHDRQIRSLETTQVNIQNSAASATHLNNVNAQVHALAGRVRDLEAALEIIAPYGVDLDGSLNDIRDRLVMLESQTWLVTNAPRVMCRKVAALALRLRLLASSRQRAQRWFRRDIESV